MLPNCLEQYYPSGVDSSSEEFNAKTLGGGRLSLKDIYDKFGIKVTYNPAPPQSELRKAFLHLASLHNEASSEKIFARQFHRANEIKIWNTILETLDYARKCLQSVNISYAVEAKVAGPVF